MPSYMAYGLTLDSELPLPELFPSSASTLKVTLRFGKVEFSGSNAGPVLYKPLSPAEVIVHYEKVGTALVRAGSEIILTPFPEVDPLTLRLYVLQQVLGVVLLQRGFFVLHASAAVANGQAVAFAGASGEGKSTLVAALNQAGFSALTDDVLAIDMTSPQRPLALPGLPQLKLTHETRIVIAPDIVTEQTIGDRTFKKLCEVHGAKLTEPVPLHSIYLLETGRTIEFKPVPKPRAAIELVRHTYGARLLQAIDLSARHFEQCVALARQIPITTLVRPRDLSLTPKVVQQIQARL